MTVPLVLESVDGERVRPTLQPLLAAVYAEVQRPIADLGALRRALEALLLYLSSSAGRTHANCVATDSFFMETDRWERTWGHLPEPYQDLLGDLGGALHDTFSAPEIAENFFSTPEQLLDQLRQIEIGSPPT
jgi:hypothetical protein